MVSPVHYGIFYEDINHAADGGLYAELIRNRSFEDDTVPCNWRSIGSAQLVLVNDGLLNDVQHNAVDGASTDPSVGRKRQQ